MQEGRCLQRKATTGWRKRMPEKKGLTKGVSEKKRGKRKVRKKRRKRRLKWGFHTDKKIPLPGRGIM